jgi:hypothetical protein
MTLKARISLFALAALAVVAITGPANAGVKLSTPTISCATATEESIDITVCAGTSGAPGGFSIHWIKAEDLAANGGIWPATDGTTAACGASFSGNAKNSRYLLAPGACVTVRIGAITADAGASTNCASELDCGTEYVFRTFAHAVAGKNRSDFSANLSCSTLACSTTECDPAVNSFGYWKTHNDTLALDDPKYLVWPATGLTLGTVNYTNAELLAILQTTPQGNGLIALAHQVITTKLNIANGAGPAYVASVSASLAAADILIGNLVVPPTGGSTASLDPSTTDTLTLALDAGKSAYHCP